MAHTSVSALHRCLVAVYGVSSRRRGRAECPCAAVLWMPPRAAAASAQAAPLAPPTTPAELLSRVDAKCTVLPGVSAKGQKVKAGKAYTGLEALLAAPESSALLRQAEVGDPAGRPRWRLTFAAVADYLSADPPAKPKDVERLEAMVGAASRAGARLASDGSLDLLLKMTLDALCESPGRAPAVVDAGVHASPHSALISLLHTLSREPHRGLRRLNPRRRRQLLSGLLEWVCGDKGKGPHPTVLARRGLMRRYAALLSALIDDWPGDMEVKIPDSRGGADDGPLSELLAFFRHVVGATDEADESEGSEGGRVLAGAEALLGSLWQSVAAAVTKHGVNAVAEVATFGSHPRIQACARERWASGGVSLHDHLTLFLRFHLASLTPCGLSPPTPRALASTLRSELLSGARLGAGAALLDASSTSEEAWHARSLLQLISAALLAHDDARPVAPVAKRARDADAEPLHTWLIHTLRSPTRPDDRPRLLLLLGTAAGPNWPGDEPRMALVRALLLLLPVAGAPAHWPTLPVVGWCLFRIAAWASEADAAWATAWHALIPLATAARGGGVAPHHAAQHATAHFCFQALHQVLRRELLPCALRQEAMAAAAAAAPSWLGQASPNPPPVFLSAAVSFCGTLCAELGRGGGEEERGREAAWAEAGRGGAGGVGAGGGEADERVSASVLIRLLAACAVRSDPLLTPALDATRPSDCARQLAGKQDVAATAFLRAVGGGTWDGAGGEGEGGHAWVISCLEPMVPSSEDAPPADTSLDTFQDGCRVDALGAFLPPRLAQLERCLEHLEAMAAGGLQETGGELRAHGAGQGAVRAENGIRADRPLEGATWAGRVDRDTAGEGGLLRVALAALDSEAERLQRGGDALQGLSESARLARMRAELLGPVLRGGGTGGAQKQALQRSLRLLAWTLHEALGGAGVDAVRWGGAADALTELGRCLASLVRLVEGAAGGAMGEWAEELLSPLSPELITLVRGVTTMLGAAAQAADSRERGSEADAAGAPVSSNNGRDALDFDDEMELDEADQRAALSTTRVEERPEAESPALKRALACVQIWMGLQPRTAARVAPELSVALQGAKGEAARHGAAACLAAAVLACHRCEEAPAPPNTAGGPPPPSVRESLISRWLTLTDSSLEPANRALASSPKQEAPLRAALRAAAAFARVVPASLPEGGSARELAPYMRLLRSAVGVCTARGGHTPSLSKLEPRTRLLLAWLMLEHLQMRVRMRERMRVKEAREKEKKEREGGRDAVERGKESEDIDEMEMVDLAEGDDGTAQLLEALKDQQWAVRCVGLRGVRILLEVNVDEEQPGLLAEAVTAIVAPDADPDEASDAPDGVPLGVLLAFLSSDPPDGPDLELLVKRRAAAQPGPPAVLSPAFERHVTALLALSSAAATSPPCRDAALALLLAAHGAGAPHPALPAMRAVSVAALHQTAQSALAESSTSTASFGACFPNTVSPGAALTARLLCDCAYGVLSLWLRLRLPLPRLPCALFVPGAAPPLAGLVRALHAPLFAAVAMANDSGTLQLAAHNLGMGGNSAGAVLGVLPAVLSALLPLRHTTADAGRHSAAMAINFVGNVLAPSSLAAEAQARHADIIEALVCSASSQDVWPRHPLRRVVKALNSNSVVGAPALALSLPKLPPARLHALILRAHAAAISTPEPDVSPLDLLLCHDLLSDQTLRRAAVPHLLQQAVLDVLGKAEAEAVREQAVGLLLKLYAAMPEEVRAALLRPMLLSCVPSAALSPAASNALASLLPSPLPPPMAAALAALPPLTLGLATLDVQGLRVLRDAQAAVRPRAEDAAARGRPVDEAVSLVAGELAFCCRFTDDPCEVRGALMHASRLLRDPSVTSRLPPSATHGTRAWLLALAAEPLSPPLAATAAQCLGMLGPPLTPGGLRNTPPPVPCPHLLALRTLHRCLVGGAGVSVALLASDGLRRAFSGAARGAALGALRALNATGVPTDRSMAFQLEPYSQDQWGHQVDGGEAPALSLDASLWRGDGEGEWECRAACACLSSAADALLRLCAPVAMVDARAAAALLTPALADVSRQPGAARPLARALSSAFGSRPDPSGCWRDATRRTLAALVVLGAAAGAPGQPQGEHEPQAEPRANGMPHEVEPPTIGLPGSAEPLTDGLFWREMDLPVAAAVAEFVGASASTLFLQELHRARLATEDRPATTATPAVVSAPAGMLVVHRGGGGGPDGVSLAAADAMCRGGAGVGGGGAGVLAPLLRRGCYSLAALWHALGRVDRVEIAWRLGRWEEGDAIGEAVQAVQRFNAEQGTPATCAAASAVSAAADTAARLPMLRLRSLHAEEAAVVPLTVLAQCETARAAALGIRGAVAVQGVSSLSQGARLSQGRASQDAGMLSAWRVRVDALLCALEAHGRGGQGAEAGLTQAGLACRRLEPLIASHAAVLQAAGAPPHELAWLWLRSAKGCRRCGDAGAARAMLCRAAEGVAGSDEVGAAVRWQSAKLLWDMGGAARAEAVSLARGLHSRLGQPGGASTPGLAALRVRVARRHGGWLDAMRWERREAVEEVLLGAQRLAEADGQTEVASAKAHFALGAFYQRQQAALAEQGASAGSLLARHVRSRLESELEDVRTQQQMLELEGSSGASSLEGNAQDRVLARLTKKRRELTELETRLRRKIEHQVKHCGDDAQGASDAFKYAELALRFFLLSLSKQSRPDAAAAAVTLWTTHADAMPALSETVAQQLTRGMPALHFVPFAPQLLARLGLATRTDQPTQYDDLMTAAPPPDTAPLVYDGAVMSLLLRAAGEEAAEDAPQHRVLLAVLAICGAFSRRSAAAATLAARLRSQLPGPMVAVEAVREAHLQLAQADFRTGASLHAEALARLHERVPLLSLAPVPGAGPHAPRLARFDPECRVVSVSPRSVSVQLWCMDTAGTRHAHLLRVARVPEGFDAHAEASLAHALAEASGRCPPIVALRQDIAVVGWVTGGVSLAVWLEIEHAAAHRAGVDTLTQAECAAVLQAGLSADGTGVVSPSLLALRRIEAATVPLLHRWLLTQAGSPSEWLERREAFGRSLGAACLAGWAVGLRGRGASNLLLVGGQGGPAVLHLNLSAPEAGVGGAAGGQAHPTGEVVQPVPFRLTRELRDALGPRGASDPTFVHAAAAALAHARKSRASILLLLTPRAAEDIGAAASLAAELAAAEVVARLGVREAGEVIVAGLAAEATDEQRLSRMGVGWRPWL